MVSNVFYTYKHFNDQNTILHLKNKKVFWRFENAKLEKLGINTKKKKKALTPIYFYA